MRTIAESLSDKDYYTEVGLRLVYLPFYDASGPAGERSGAWATAVTAVVQYAVVDCSVSF